MNKCRLNAFLAVVVLGCVFTLLVSMNAAEGRENAKKEVLRPDIGEAVELTLTRLPCVKSNPESGNDPVSLWSQGGLIMPGRELSGLKKISLGEFKLTAYCSCETCCGKWALNRPKDENGKDIVYGSTGTILVAGISIAVDPSVIPYGSQVEINGHTYEAHDTGGAIKGNRIDVYFDDHQEARVFGVQYAEVFLVGGGQ